MVRHIEKLALLAAIEAGYGDDAEPGAANAMQVTNVSYEVGHDEVAREVTLPYRGHKGVFLVGKHVLMSFDVEIAGPGAEGIAPGWAPLLRMAAFSEEIVGADLVYRPARRGFVESGSLYYNLDGVNHVALGARGSVKLTFNAQQIPRFSFTLKGLLGTFTDVALPAASFAGFGTPVPVNKANTSFALHGYAGATESVTIDMAGGVEPRLIINSETIEYVERRATGEAIMDAPLLAVQDWFAIAQAHGTGTLALQHGTAAGNVVLVEAPVVQIGMPKYEGRQKIAAQSLKLFLRPTPDGNDEVAITVPGAGVSPFAFVFGGLPFTFDGQPFTYGEP